MYAGTKTDNNHANLVNVVNSKIDIDGTVNAIRNNRIGGNLYFLSSDGMAVSSGGVIARLAQHALAVTDLRTIDFNLSLMNSAISEFVWRDGLRMRSWNTLPHLSQHVHRRLWTHF